MSQYRLKPDLIDSNEIIYVPFTGGLEQSLDYPPVRSAKSMVMLDCTQAVVGIAIKECRSSFLGFVRQSVEEVLAKLLNRSLKRPLSFESEIDLTSDFGVSLKEFLQFMGRAKDPQPMVLKG